MPLHTLLSGGSRAVLNITSQNTSPPLICGAVVSVSKPAQQLDDSAQITVLKACNTVASSCTVVPLGRGSEPAQKLKTTARPCFDQLSNAFHLLGVFSCRLMCFVRNLQALAA